MSEHTHEWVLAGYGIDEDGTTEVYECVACHATRTVKVAD